MSEIPASQIFEDRSERFATIVLSPRQVKEYEPDSIEQEYLRLRANVYIDQTGILDESSRRPDGTEIDSDDLRAAHFVSLEQKLGRLAIVGCMRLPQKLLDKSHLPIEQFFPEAFGEPAPVGSIEVSRLIVNHEDVLARDKIKKQLIANGLAYIFDNNLGPVYAVVEDYLMKDLENIGVPLKPIAKPKYIDKYHSENIGIEVDRFKLAQRLGKRLLQSLQVEYGSTNYFEV